MKCSYYIAFELKDRKRVIPILNELENRGMTFESNFSTINNNILEENTYCSVETSSCVLLLITNTTASLRESTVKNIYTISTSLGKRIITVFLDNIPICKVSNAQKFWFIDLEKTERIIIQKHTTESVSDAILGYIGFSSDSEYSDARELNEKEKTHFQLVPLKKGEVITSIKSNSRSFLLLLMIVLSSVVISFILVYCIKKIEILVTPTKLAKTEYYQEDYIFTENDVNNIHNGGISELNPQMYESIMQGTYTNGTENSNNYNYIVNGDFIKIIGPTNRSLNKLIIPAVIEGKPVTNIGGFSGCRQLKTVSLPETITYIGDGAFKDCIHLEKINIPESVSYIGKEAFCFCRQLKTVIIPEGINCIYESTFLECENLEKVNIPDSVIEIEATAFKLCQNLRQIKMGSNIKKINNNAFYSCYSLKSINFPETLEYIGDECFTLCTSLSEIVIPANVDIIRVRCFAGCNSLKSLIIKGQDITINKEAFSYCGNLKTVRLNSCFLYEDSFKGCLIDDVYLSRNDHSFLRNANGCYVEAHFID